MTRLQRLWKLVMMQYPCSTFLLSHKKGQIFLSLCHFQFANSYRHPKYLHFSFVIVQHKPPKSLFGRRDRAFFQTISTQTQYFIVAVCVYILLFQARTGKTGEEKLFSTGSYSLQLQKKKMLMSEKLSIGPF